MRCAWKNTPNAHRGTSRHPSKCWHGTVSRHSKGIGNSTMQMLIADGASRPTMHTASPAWPPCCGQTTIPAQQAQPFPAARYPAQHRCSRTHLQSAAGICRPALPIPPAPGAQQRQAHLAAVVQVLLRTQQAASSSAGSQFQGGVPCSMRRLSSCGQVQEVVEDGGTWCVCNVAQSLELVRQHD
jgi:hypothetical protein